MSLKAEDKANSYALFVQEELKVYQSPDESSPIISTLDMGQEVPVSRAPKNGFYKVLLKGPGGQKIGHVAASDMMLSYIQELNGRGKKQTIRAQQMRDKNTWGAFIGLSNRVQESRSFVVSDGSGTYQLEEATHQGLFIGLAADFVLDSNWGIKAFVSLRPESYSADASIGMSEFEVETNSLMLGGGATVKKYFWQIPLWLGLGGEVAKGLQTEVKISGTETETEESPFQFFNYFALGYEWPLLNGFLCPELRYGGSFSTDPQIITAEFNLGYSF